MRRAFELRDDVTPHDIVYSALAANALADDEADGRAARSLLAAGDDLAGPDLLDLQSVAALHRRWIAGDLSPGRTRR